MLRWILAALHLLALGIGLGAVWGRSRALRAVPEPGAVRRALRADAWWGVAALLWLGTGLPRLLSGTEKPTAYYLANSVFWAKLGGFLLLVALELGPAADLTRWRRGLRRGEVPDTARAGRWAALSQVEAGLVIVIVFAATAMARGYGSR